VFMQFVKMTKPCLCILISVYASAYDKCYKCVCSYIECTHMWIRQYLLHIQELKQLLEQVNNQMEI